MISNSSSKSARCTGSKLVERLLPPLLVFRANHFANGQDALFLKEHVLGAAKPDAFGAERSCLPGVARRVGVRAHLHAARLSAHSIIVANVPDSCGGSILALAGDRRGRSCRRSRSMSPAYERARARPHRCRRWHRCAAFRHPTRTAAPCRARRRPRGWSCRRARSKCRPPRACRGRPRGSSRDGRE